MLGIPPPLHAAQVLFEQRVQALDRVRRRERRPE
jgi:hypothetical protein